MNYVYSANNNMFYPQEYRKQYELNNDWPVDAVDVTDDIFLGFTGKPPEGKRRIVGADGLPAWGDIPPPSEEDIIAGAEVKKIQLRTIADAEIAWRQDAFDTGIATEEETAALLEWKKYRVLLMRVDTTKPIWPTVPGVSAI